MDSYCSSDTTELAKAMLTVQAALQPALTILDGQPLCIWYQPLAQQGIQPVSYALD